MLSNLRNVEIFDNKNVKFIHFLVDIRAVSDWEFT